MTVIRIGCSPDSDDAFMFYALVHREIDTEGLSFTVESHDTDTLNALADEERIDVLAVSVARYATIADRYLLLPHGASVGRGYGPVVVAKTPCALGALAGKRVAVPGLQTTAYFVLRILLERSTRWSYPLRHTRPCGAHFDRARSTPPSSFTKGV